MKNLQQRIDKIKAVLIALDWTQKQLETASGLGYSTIWRLVNGKGDPRKSTIILLEMALGIDK